MKKPNKKNELIGAISAGTKRIRASPKDVLKVLQELVKLKKAGAF